jgi:hypothetical protein
MTSMSVRALILAVSVLTIGPAWNVAAAEPGLSSSSYIITTALGGSREAPEGFASRLFIDSRPLGRWFELTGFGYPAELLCWSKLPPRVIG